MRIAALGAWGAAYHLSLWLGEHTDPAFFTSGPIHYTDFLLQSAQQLRRDRFCRS